MKENVQVEQKAAFVALVGRPSVGKSTLINRLCGEKVSIVSRSPQTTRNAIRGIVNRTEGQLVFVDTPGRHISKKKINRRLLEVSGRNIEDADIVLYLLDATRVPGTEESAVADYLVRFSERLVAAVNKIDIQTDTTETISFLKNRFSALPQNRIFRISAMRNDGLDPLLKKIFDIAPTEQPFYPSDCYTDQNVQFRIAEIIRGKAVNRLKQELPHSIYVEIADAEFKDTEMSKKLWVRAFIVTERESQKGILIGKGGQMVKSIRLAALDELQRIFDWEIELDLRIKTVNDWRNNDTLLKRLTSE
ncbi:MAG: GTPase Era [Treponema sp.]|jgi:GTP-binding protein Era|nr:GTPase Era [Treponema sp.]